ncbi:OB-fold nucleic acid binding domain-containing protein [Streptomyces sp. M19]
MHRYRSHTCGELRSSDVGTDVRLSGWLHNRRDLGGILFIDLRDHYGLVQLVARPGTPPTRPCPPSPRRPSSGSTARW